MPELIVRREGPIGRVIFSNPDKYNAVTQDMWLALPRALQQFDADPEVRLVVIEGDGDKADEAAKEEGSDKSESDSSDEGSSDEGSSEGAGDEGPPPIEEKPGGCGCRVPGAPGGSHRPLAAVLALGAFAFVRRRTARC